MPSHKASRVRPFVDARLRDVATGAMRIAAATFALERRFFPSVTIEKRVDATEVVRLIRKKPIKGVRASLDARTLRAWREGSLKNDPTYLRSLCEANSEGSGFADLLHVGGCMSTFQQHLRALDVYAWESSAQTGSAAANEKVLHALTLLDRLERDWRVVGVGLFKEGTLALSGRGGDTELIRGGPSKATRTLTVPDSFSEWQACREPQRVLQWLLRLALYVHELPDLPIHRYAVDLSTAYLATATLEKWDATWPRCSKAHWVKIEALDAAHKLFFRRGLSIRKAVYLLHSGHPWADFQARHRSDHPSELTVARNARRIRNAYRNALREAGINPKNIVQLSDRTAAEVRAAEFGAVGQMSIDTYLECMLERLSEEEPSKRITRSQQFFQVDCVSSTGPKPSPPTI